MLPTIDSYYMSTVGAAYRIRFFLDVCSSLVNSSTYFDDDLKSFLNNVYN